MLHLPRTLRGLLLDPKRAPFFKDRCGNSKEQLPSRSQVRLREAPWSNEAVLVSGHFVVLVCFVLFVGFWFSCLHNLLFFERNLKSAVQVTWLSRFPENVRSCAIDVLCHCRTC